MVSTNISLFRGIVPHLPPQQPPRPSAFVLTREELAASPRISDTWHPLPDFPQLKRRRGNPTFLRSYAKSLRLDGLIQCFHRPLTPPTRRYIPRELPLRPLDRVVALTVHERNFPELGKRHDGERVRERRDLFGNAAGMREGWGLVGCIYLFDNALQVQGLQGKQ